MVLRRVSSETLNDRLIGDPMTKLSLNFASDQTQEKKTRLIARKKETIKSQFDVVIKCCPSSHQQVLRLVEKFRKKLVNRIAIHLSRKWLLKSSSRSRKANRRNFCKKKETLQQCWEKITIDSVSSLIMFHI